MKENPNLQSEIKTGEASARRILTILIPAYNERATLGALVSELGRLAGELLPAAELHYAYDVEYLVVDDGSTDGSLQLLESLRRADPRLHYVSLSRNFGKEKALMAGLDFARGDCVVLMDADMQHPVQTVVEMLRRWEQGYDDVYGHRLTRTRESFLRRHFTKAYYKLLQKTTRIDVLPGVGDFRLLDRRCADALRAMGESHRYTKGLLCWIGYKKIAVDYEEQNRFSGKSNYSYRRLFNLALEGITGFTTAPLRFASILGIVVSAVAFIYIIFILCKTLLWGEPVQGYPTLMCAILFLGGCQLLALGIIGEYIGRIFNESKRRPVYIAQSYDGKKI